VRRPTRLKQKEHNQFPFSAFSCGNAAIRPIEFSLISIPYEDPMRTVFVAVAAAALAVFGSFDADAQSGTKRQVRGAQPSTVVVQRDESGRTRTRVLVQRRSYLDGGTEVMPGSMNYTNYVNSPTHRPSAVLSHNVITNPPGPIPDPWFLPGKHNPWPWFVP
jgi:hypothetical protein